MPLDMKRKIKLLTLLIWSNLLCFAQNKEQISKEINGLFQKKDAEIFRLCILSHKPVKDFIIYQEKSKNIKNERIEYFEYFGVNYADMFSFEQTLEYLTEYLLSQSQKKRQKTIDFLKNKLFVSEKFFFYYLNFLHYTDYHAFLFKVDKSIEKIVLKKEPDYYEEYIDPRSIDYTIIEYLCKNQQLQTKIFNRLEDYFKP
jgi:hypothetical protein